MKNRFDVKRERHGCTFNDNASATIFGLMALPRTRPNTDRRIPWLYELEPTKYGKAYSRAISREAGGTPLRIVATALGTVCH